MPRRPYYECGAWPTMWEKWYQFGVWHVQLFGASTFRTSCSERYWYGVVNSRGVEQVHANPLETGLKEDATEVLRKSGVIDVFARWGPFIDGKTMMFRVREKDAEATLDAIDVWAGGEKDA